MKTFTVNSCVLAVAAIFGPLTSSAQTPPAITIQPAAAVVHIGDPVTLSAGVSGTGVGFQWLKDGTILSGRTNSSISFGSFRFTNCGNYQLVASNSSGLAISLPAALSVPSAPLRVWGRNDYGQLGNGTISNLSQPTSVASHVVAVAAGLGSSLVVKSDGTLWTMGYNNYGQLGTGTTNNSPFPTFVASNVISVAAGAYHSLFLESDGTLWTMGENFHGELGNGTTDYYAHPNPVNVASNVVAVAAGYEHSLFVKNDGTLWTMGYNLNGQLGNGTTSDTNRPVNVASNVVTVAAGYWHSLFVKSDGTLWVMGDHYYGQLGNGLTGYGFNTTPVNVASNVVATAGGGNHSLFVKSDGTLWAMGYNAYGQLGNGTTSDTNRPVNVASNVVAAAAGGAHSLFVKNNGTLWAMGMNWFGQLGNGSEDTSVHPNPLPVSSLTVATLGAMDSALHSVAVAVPPPGLSLTSLTSAGTTWLNLQVSGLADCNYVLQTANNLANPIQWAPVQTNVTDTNGVCVFVVTNLTAPQKFYQIAPP